MSLKNVITAVMTEIKQKLTDFCKDVDEDATLTPELYLSISTGLKDSLAAGGIAGLRTLHLGAAAEALFGKNSQEGKSWYSKWKRKLKEENGAALKLCRSIEYFLTDRRLGKTRKAEAQKQLTFFRRNKKRMNYIDFINKGLPIGSGPVEAACKTIVKQRMCKSGMRWSREGGQPILSIRAIVKSQRWDRFWKLTVSKQHEQMQAAA